MYLDIVISNVFNLNKPFFFSFHWPCFMFQQAESLAYKLRDLEKRLNIYLELYPRDNEQLEFIIPSVEKAERLAMEVSIVINMLSC